MFCILFKQFQGKILSMNTFIDTLGKRSRQRINELPSSYHDTSLEKYFSPKTDSRNKSQSTLYLMENSGCHRLCMELWST